MDGKISYSKSYMPFQKYICQNMNNDTFISGWDIVSKSSNISQKMIKTENKGSSINESPICKLKSLKCQFMVQNLFALKRF